MANKNIEPKIEAGVFNLYKNIQYLREQEGLTTKQLAEIIGISKRRLIKVESCTDINGLYDTHIKQACIHFAASSDMLFHEKLS